MTGKILAIDDSPETRKLLDITLTKQGFCVKTASTVKAAISSIKTQKPDLILLDIVLPDSTGLSLTKNLKNTSQYSDIPIILLTCKNSDTDIVKGFETGADDYIVKPIKTNILLARITALLNRCRPDLSKRDKFIIGPITIDLKNRQTFLQDKIIPLTPGEFLILTELAKANSTPVSRALLADKINASRKTRVIDTHITSIRKKLSFARKYLRTVHSIGYKLIVPSN